MNRETAKSLFVESIIACMTRHDLDAVEFCFTFDHTGLHAGFSRLTGNTPGPMASDAYIEFQGVARQPLAESGGVMVGPDATNLQGQMHVRRTPGGFVAITRYGTDYFDAIGKRCLG